MKGDSGEIAVGTTIKSAYLPNDNSAYFNSNESLIDWLRKFAETEEEREDVYLRTFLGRMLFTGEEALKSSNVLSGGGKARCFI